MQFPIGKTKTEGATVQKFDINDFDERQKYFRAKAGKEIDAIKAYLDSGKTFVAFLLGKKNSGKGTYSKLFMEAVGKDHVAHLSVGDIVRDIHAQVETEEGKAALVAFLKENYRGFHSVDETIDQILGRSQTTLLSSDLTMALIKFEVSKHAGKAIFLDGFPRSLDQVGHSLYFKDSLGYKSEPDFFVFISVANSIIDERIKYRVVCPICKTPRNLKLLATRDVGYDPEKKQFYLMCDTPTCNKARMYPKEGDELGIEPIRARIEMDQKIFDNMLTLHGVDKVYLRNSVPVDVAKDYVDGYELTPGYDYKLRDDDTVETIENLWTIKDDDGIESYSLLPAAVVISLLKQVGEILGI